MRMVVRVYHSMYGCETGCCGHIVEYSDGKKEFEFGHAYDDETPIEFAKRVLRGEFSEAHLADLDWTKVDLEEVKDYGH